MKKLTILIITNGLLFISSCTQPVGVKNKVIIVMNDSNISSFDLSTCKSRVVISEAFEYFEYTFRGCTENGYRIKILYKDGTVIDETVGYIPGGVPSQYTINILNKKIVALYEKPTP